MLRRLPAILIALILADMATLLLVSCCCDWKVPLVQNVASAILGLVVIVRYERRWSSTVAAHLGVDDSKPFGCRNVEKVLLLVAGVLLVVPGFVTDVFGLFLLLPSIRQKMASRLVAAN
jgi:UPF0716 protein FxsA